MRRNSLYFSLLAGNWGREEFAQDCVHRHQVVIVVIVTHYRVRYRFVRPKMLGSDQSKHTREIRKSRRRVGLAGFKAWPSVPFLPTVMGIEVVLIIAASLVLASDAAHRVAIFVIFVSSALGLQNGAFRRVGGISVHTAYLTGMITSLISTEAEKHASGETPPPMKAPDPQIRLLCGIWAAFVLGAGTGAAIILKRLGCWEPRCS
jgi:Protein of unknown function (DUF1275)